MPFMRRTVLKLLGTSACLPWSALSAFPAPSTAGSIDWAAFLARHDLIWDRLPRNWDEGPFLGNGMIGAMLYYDEAPAALRLDVGRADVQDHRTPMMSVGYDRARLPIGHFLLRTAGTVREPVSLRLSLHDAMLEGSIHTDRGTVSLRAYVHAEDMAIIVKMHCSPGEAGAHWEWIGEEAISPRQSWGLRYNDALRTNKNYRNNPLGRQESEGEEELWLQPLSAGGGTATAWRQHGNALIVSVMHDHPGDGARAQALKTVRRIRADRNSERRHLRWWHGYYPASFLSIPDTRIESFYWIQMYKLASATRHDRAYIDNQGPWLQPTPWPFATWNLNVQLNYWAMVPANRAHLAGSLVRALDENRQNLIDNILPAYRADSASLARGAGTDLVSPVGPPQPGSQARLIDGLGTGGGEGPPEMGDLPWALHNVWLIWRHTMDEHLLRDTIFPLLRRATNYYRHFLTRGDDGKLHLPLTYSPEYGAAPDLNYDLALLRWSCGALLDAATRLRIDDPLIPQWRQILAELVDYPQDQTGYMIGAGMPLSSSHRHYSHLLMIYPLYLVNREQNGATSLIERSLKHWRSMPEELRGYSSTGASSISSALGKGDDALAYLKELLDDYVRPNSFYKESGPVIETPLSGAQSIHDMLLQSWGGTIRPFPAMPVGWAESVFADLSAEGAFLVSARRQAGRTAWVRVESRAGEPFALETDILAPVALVNGRSRVLRPDGPRRWRADLRKGETILIFPAGSPPRTDIAPLTPDVPNSFGLNPRSALKQQRDMSL